MGCDSIATTISRMGKEPTTLGPEDLKGHRFSAFWLSVSSLWDGQIFSLSVFGFFSCLFVGAVLSTGRAGTPCPPPQIYD